MNINVTPDIRIDDEVALLEIYFVTPSIEITAKIQLTDLSEFQYYLRHLIHHFVLSPKQVHFNRITDSHYRVLVKTRRAVKQIASVIKDCKFKWASRTKQSLSHMVAYIPKETEESLGPLLDYLYLCNRPKVVPQFDIEVSSMVGQRGKYFMSGRRSQLEKIKQLFLYPDQFLKKVSEFDVSAELKLVRHYQKIADDSATKQLSEMLRFLESID